MTKLQTTTVGCPGDHFKEVNRSVSFLRKSANFCDLFFICHPNENSKNQRTKTVSAHQAIFMPHSKLITEIVEIAQKKQPSESIYINVPNIDELLFEKLIEYLYLGQTTIKKNQEKDLENLITLLNLDFSLDAATLSENSDADDNELEVLSVKKRGKKPAKKEASDDEDNEEEIFPVKKRGKKPAEPAKKEASDDEDNEEEIFPVKKRGRKPLQSAKKETRAIVESSDDEVKESDGEELDRLKTEAMSKRIVKINLEPVEKSSEKDAKKYYRKATTFSPVEQVTSTKPSTSVTGSKTKAESKKRRLTDSDKKVVDKAPKKARQEDDDDSSEVDTDAFSARKKEIALVGSSSSKPVFSDSESEPAERSGKRSFGKAKKLYMDDSEDEEEKENSEESKEEKRKKGPKGKVGPTSKAKPAGPASKTKASEAKAAAGSPSRAKPGPKRKKPTTDDSLATNGAPKSTKKVSLGESLDSVCICKFCGKIYIGTVAYNQHLKENHDENSGDQSEEERGRKPGPRQKGKVPAVRKVSPSESASDDDSNFASLSKTKRPASITSESSFANRRNRSPSNLSSDDDTAPPLKLKENPFAVKKSSASKDLDQTSTDGEEKATKKTPVNKKGRPRQSIGTTEKKKPSRLSIGEDSISEGGSSGPVKKCTQCHETFDKTSNFRNHLANHFKDQLYQDLPSLKPFICPECSAVVRDRVSLMRHYAFTHKKILNYISEEDLKGEVVEGETVPVKKSKLGAKPGSSRKSGGTSKKAKNPQPENEDESENEAEEKDTHVEERKEAPKVTTTVDFSDSDSDEAVLTQSTTNALKSFDDLFNETTEKEEAKKKVPSNENGDKEENKVFSDSD